MNLHMRLDRIAKESGVGSGWIESELADEVMQALMEHRLLMHGTEGAESYARDLHARRDRCPRTIPPMPQDVRQQLDAMSREVRLEHERLHPNDYAELHRSCREREELARQYLEAAWSS